MSAKIYNFEVTVIRAKRKSKNILRSTSYRKVVMHLYFIEGLKDHQIISIIRK